MSQEVAHGGFWNEVVPWTISGSWPTNGIELPAADVAPDLFGAAIKPMGHVRDLEQPIRTCELNLRPGEHLAGGVRSAHPSTSARTSCAFHTSPLVAHPRVAVGAGDFLRHGRSSGGRGAEGLGSAAHNIPPSPPHLGQGNSCGPGSHAGHFPAGRRSLFSRINSAAPHFRHAIA